MNMQPLTEPRLDARTAFGAIRAMTELKKYLLSTNLEPVLLDLVMIRASQLNGCAFCIDEHTSKARSRGEREERLYMLSVWREASLYTNTERAALAWTEAITDIQDGHAPDEAYEAVRPHFSGEDLADLTLAIAAINAANRLAIGFRMVPGSYVQPKAAKSP